jgi:hypothetical protein
MFRFKTVRKNCGRKKLPGYLGQIGTLVDTLHPFVEQRGVRKV